MNIQFSGTPVYPPVSSQNQPKFSGYYQAIGHRDCFRLITAFDEYLVRQGHANAREDVIAGRAPGFSFETGPAYTSQVVVPPEHDADFLALINGYGISLDRSKPGPFRREMLQERGTSIPPEITDKGLRNKHLGDSLGW